MSAVLDGGSERYQSGSTPADKGSRKPKRSDRKTVTFGDSSAVRSLPLWSLFALVSLVGFWFVATFAWGFPEEFNCLLYTSPSPRDLSTSRMPSSA